MAFRSSLAYTGVAQPTPPNQVINNERAPTAKDYNFNIGDRWIVPTRSTAPSNQEWVLMSKPQNVAVWVQVNAAGATTYNDHEVLVGTGTSTINTINNSTAGLPLLTQGAGADPLYAVLAVPAGGTDKTSFTAYAPILGGTTATGALQSVAALGAAGTVLTSNGAGAAATFQAPFSGVVPVPNGGTGDTTVAAYEVVCGGITNVDPLQTVGSLGTAGQVLTSQGAGALPQWVTNATSPGFTSIVVQTFTTDGTYTPTAGMEYCIVEALGGGGGAGGGTSPGALSAGAGAGGYCRKVIDAATIGVSQVVTIGAGGAGGVGAATGSTGGITTFGAILTANGGVGSSVGAVQLKAPGIGGTASGGDINVPGQPGLYNAFGGSVNGSGSGANSMYGSGGVGRITGGLFFFENGNPGLGYGSGGGGGWTFNLGSFTGGAGASGLVIVTEYIG